MKKQPLKIDDFLSSWKLGYIFWPARNIPPPPSKIFSGFLRSFKLHKGILKCALSLLTFFSSFPPFSLPFSRPPSNSSLFFNLDKKFGGQNIYFPGWKPKQYMLPNRRLSPKRTFDSTFWNIISILAWLECILPRIMRATDRKTILYRLLWKKNVHHSDMFGRMN